MHRYTPAVLLLLFGLSAVCADRTVPFSGNRKINDEFCGIKNGTENCGDYLQYVAYTRALPGAVMATLSFLGFFAYLCFHCIACCCCRMVERRPAPSKGFIMATRILIIFSVLAVIASFVVMIIGNIGTTASVKRVEGTIVDMEVHIATSVHNVSVALEKMPLINDIQMARDLIESVKKAEITLNDDIIPTTKRGNEHATFGDKIRFYVVTVVFILPILLGILSTIGAIFRIRGCTVTAGILLFLVSGFLWTSFSLHFTIQTVSTDICRNPISLIESAAGNSSDSLRGVKLVTGCLTGQNTFRKLVLTIKDGAYDTACAALKDACKKPEQVECPEVACSETSITQYYGALVFDKGNGMRKKLTDCADNCIDKDARDVSKAMVSMIQTVVVVGTNLRDVVAPVVDCTKYTNSFNDITDAICNNLNTKTKMISYSSLADAIALIVLTIASLLGWISFRHITSAEEEQLLSHDEKLYSHDEKLYKNSRYN